jgi:trans-aconitate methyltransferase
MTTPWLKQNARRLTKARALLQPALIGAGPVWADLGCGEGIFTYLLHEFLPADNTIYAVDKSRRALHTLARSLAGVAPEAVVQPIQADFSQPLDLPPLDGLLLANALHFLKDKKPPLLRLIQYLNPGGRLVIIEYNTNRGNWAVPYPLDEDSFIALAAAVGLREARIVARKPSTFLGEMYTGLGFYG